MKKKLAKVMTAMLLSLLAICLVSCHGDSGQSESTGTASGPETLVVAIQADSFVSDYEDNYFTQYMEDKLGINIEFYMLSVNPEDVRTQVSLLATGGDDLPDVLLVSGTTLNVTPGASYNSSNVKFNTTTGGTTYDDINLSGTLRSPVQGAVDQRVIVTDDLVVKGNVTIEVAGQFIVQEGATVTLETGAKVILLNGSTATIDGDITVQAGAANAQTLQIGTGATVDINGSITLAGADSFTSAGDININGTFTVNYGSDVTVNGSMTVTGDLNIVDVEWIVQYRINDPMKWLFNVEDKETTIRDISQSVMNALVGDLPILSVMTDLRPQIEVEAQQQMQAIFDGYDFGSEVVTVKLQNIVPPEGAVQDAFEDVNKAIQDMNKSINEGKEYYNTAIPEAQGEATRIVLEAEGYAAQRVNQAKGDVAVFDSMRASYEASPEVTATRLHLEAMEEVLSSDGGSITLVDPALDNFLPVRNLGGAK